ncbi:MAG TPA: transglutaminase N-terminal domain-containing protein, partial [Dehalococcoidia bacterium]|nr:transglutaminase N-terminal domain-containing protein [Dehalococcoidia bacterium]
MLWTIRHSTRYMYSAPVFLEPHVLRLTPISDATQRLIEFEL